MNKYLQIKFFPATLNKFMIAAYPTTEALPVPFWSRVTTALSDALFDRAVKVPIDAVALLERII